MLYCYSFSAVTACSFEQLADGKSLIKTKLNCLTALLSSAINNKERETWKLQCENTRWNAHMTHGSTQGRVEYMVHESYMGNTL